MYFHVELGVSFLVSRTGRGSQGTRTLECFINQKCGDGAEGGTCCVFPDKHRKSIARLDKP